MDPISIIIGFMGLVIAIGLPTYFYRQQQAKDKQCAQSSELQRLSDLVRDAVSVTYSHTKRGGYDQACQILMEVYRHLQLMDHVLTEQCHQLAVQCGKVGANITCGDLSFLCDANKTIQLGASINKLSSNLYREALAV